MEAKTITVKNWMGRAIYPFNLEVDNPEYPCPELENTKEGDTVDAVLQKQVLNVFDTWEFISDDSYEKYLKLNESQVHKHYQLRDAYRLVTPKSETEKGEAAHNAEIRSAEQVLRQHLHGYSDEQFNKEITRFPLCEVPFAMHEYHEQFGDGWISVDERLPDHCYDVLVCYKDNDPEIGRLYHSRKKGTYTFVTPNELSGLDVTHWQPLPQKPQTQKS